MLEDRKKAFKCLQVLHQTARGFNLNHIPYIDRYHLLPKWIRRFQYYAQMEKKLVGLIGDYYGEIYKQVENAIEMLVILERQQSNVALPLLHGDVVHHNFLLLTNGQIKLIDFDLASIGVASQEYILWEHRVLPYLNYDVTKLCEEIPQLNQISNINCYFQYPNELLRESLFLLQLPQPTQKLLTEKFLLFARHALQNWPRLNVQVK